MKPAFTMGAQLPELVVFVAVAERGSFTAAAAALNVSPSAVSQSVRRLEQRVGAPLLARTTRSVRPTEAGQRLLTRVGPALREAQAALEDASGEGGSVAGTLRLTIPRLAVSLVLAPLLGPLRAAHPALQLDVSVDDAFVELVGSGYDAGIRLSEAIGADMIAVRLTAPFRFLIVGTPAYLRARGTPHEPAALLAHDCVGFRGQSTGALYRWELERQGEELQIAVDGPLVTNDSALMVAAALQGVGLAYVCELTVQAELARGELVPVLESWAPRVPGFFAYFPAAVREQPKLRAFLEVARRTLAAPPSERS